MSGGGGSGGGGPDTAIDCASFVATTEVLSPDPAVVNTTKKNTVGTLQLGSAVSRPVQVVLPGNAILGSVSPPGVAKLKQCIADGFKYKATVVAISGGAVRVEIRPK
ncbi:MAG TPA: hypothetical protein VJR92_10975 [Gemmatimonadaceae bacterium]|nr:hypothetical protein [Gemmatimonadaceae bacterium]